MTTKTYFYVAGALRAGRIKKYIGKVSSRDPSLIDFGRVAAGRLGKDTFETRPEALAAALTMKASKIAEHKAAIARLEALEIK